MRIKKGDTVKVIAGKDKGKIGKVLRVLRDRERVVVEGVNVRKRHLRFPRRGLEPGIHEINLPIHVSNVMLICPNCGEATRVGYKIFEDGSKARVCKKCGQIIDYLYRPKEKK